MNKSGKPKTPPVPLEVVVGCIPVLNPFIIVSSSFASSSLRAKNSNDRLNFLSDILLNIVIAFSLGANPAKPKRFFGFKLSVEPKGLVAPLKAAPRVLDKSSPVPEPAPFKNSPPAELISCPPASTTADATPVANI